MKKYLYILYILAFCFIGLSSCQEETLLEEKTELEKDLTEEGYANLEISMNAPALQVESRTLASDPKNQGGSWTNWEKFVDGALLYRVTLFVIDNNNKLVAYRNFYSGSSDIKAETEQEGGNGFYETSAVNTSAHTGVAVKATFSHQYPMHGPIEKLKPGTYKLIAVANYAPIDATNDTSLFTADETPTAYAGLGNVAEDDRNKNGLGGDFTEIVNEIIGTSFNGVDDFNQNNYSKFFDYKLNSGTDRVCKQLPQPLVMIREVTLNKGDNSFTGVLSRTFARVRLEVQRTNVNDEFYIHDLSFKGPYASQNAYLFNDVTAGSVIAAQGTTGNGTYTASNTVNLHNHFELYGTVTSTADNDGNYTYTVTDGTAGPLGVSSDDCIVASSGFVFTDDVEENAYIFLDCYILEGKINSTETNPGAFSFTATYWDAATGGTATENFRIGAFTNYTRTDDKGSEELTGLATVDVYVLDTESPIEKTDGNKDNKTNYLYPNVIVANTENNYSTEGDVSVDTETYGDNIIENQTDIESESIWRIILNEIRINYPQYSTDAITNSDAKPGVGVAYGYFLSIGTGLYLQPYNGETTEDGNDDLTPRIGTNKAELIFKIDFSDEYEKGTIFCNYNGTYYYLDSNDDHVISWVSTELNENNVLDPSSNVIKTLTFNTINGSQGGTTNVPIVKEILVQTSTGSYESDSDNKIVRNDFYYATIPVQLESN